MTQIDAERAVRERSRPPNLRADEIGGTPKHPEYAQPSRVGHRGYQVGEGDGAHSRLDHWMADAERSRESSGNHGRSFLCQPSPRRNRESLSITDDSVDPLLDHLIRPLQERRRDRQAQSLGGLEVDRQVISRRLLDW